jgi:hypothetical protein
MPQDSGQYGPVPQDTGTLVTVRQESGQHGTVPQDPRAFGAQATVRRTL